MGHDALSRLVFVDEDVVGCAMGGCREEVGKAWEEVGEIGGQR